MKKFDEPASDRTVVILDESQYTLHQLTRLLVHGGFSVDVAVTLEHVRHLVTACVPVAVVINIAFWRRYPDVFRQLKDLTAPKPPLTIVIAAKSGRDSRRALLAAGADNSYKCPVDLNIVVRNIQDHIGL